MTELRKALEGIAQQHLPHEMEEEQAENADYEAGYIAIVLLAREALTSQSPPPADVWFCETCKAEVHPETVTYDERHELCGTHLSGSSPPPTDDVRALVERLRNRIHDHRFHRDNTGTWPVPIRSSELETLLTALSAQLPLPIYKAGHGFDAAVAAIEAWAEGFTEPSDTASRLRLTAKDLQRNRDTILASNCISPPPIMGKVAFSRFVRFALEDDPAKADGKHLVLEEVSWVDHDWPDGLRMDFDVNGRLILATPSSPEGWVLVPREPTQEMIAAAQREYVNSCSLNRDMKATWAIMLAASPSSKENKP